MAKMPFPAACTLALLLLLVQTSAAPSYSTYIVPEKGTFQVEIGHSQLCLERLNFELLDSGRGFDLHVLKGEMDGDHVYEYFEIRATGLEADVGNVILDTRMERSWVEQNNVGISTIAISFFDDGWKRLHTVKLSEDSDYLHFRSESPSLSGLFAVTGEPVPVGIEFTIICNGDGVCEPERGEDDENCRDCLSEAPPSKCVPFESYCLDDSVFECNYDGTDYNILRCENGCYEGACLAAAPGVPTGMLIYGNPVALGVIAILFSLVVYLMFSLRKIRRELSSAEQAAKNY